MVRRKLMCRASHEAVALRAGTRGADAVLADAAGDKRVGAGAPVGGSRNRVPAVSAAANGAVDIRCAAAGATGQLKAVPRVLATGISAMMSPSRRIRLVFWP